MRKFLNIFIIVLLLASIGGIHTFAQGEDNGQLWFCWEASVKPPLRDQFIKLQLDFQSKLKENDFPYRFSTWSDGNFAYHFFYPVDSYNDKNDIYEALGAIAQQWGEDNFTKMWETVQSHRTYFIKSLPAMSYSPEEPRLANEEMTFAIWDMSYIKPGKESEVEALGRKYSALLKSKGYNDHIQMMKGDLGLEGSVYMGVVYGKDAEDMWSQNKKMWEQMGDEGSAIFQKWMAITDKREFKQFWNSKKLSYKPEE